MSWNKTGKVGPRTHRLVLLTVKRLGYLPNAHARHLASRDSRTLGIIVSDIVNPFFPEVTKSFETRARQLGYDAILSDTNYDPRRTREAAERMMEHNVCGVAIMTSEISSRLILEFERRRIAVTFLDLAPFAAMSASCESTTSRESSKSWSTSINAGTGASPSSPEGQNSSPTSPGWKPTKRARGMWDWNRDRSYTETCDSKAAWRQA
jgi:hypothetical protein